MAGTHLPSEITKEIEGEYTFTYNTGQVEVLKINLDSSYSKAVYSNEASYKEKKDTLFYNEGTWGVNGKLVDFHNWLWCNDDVNKNNLIANPFKCGVGGISWRESEGDKPASFLLFDEPWYLFVKVSTKLKK